MEPQSQPAAAGAASGPRLSALIVDDDPETLSALGELVEAQGFAVQTAASLAEADDLLAEGPPSVILADLMLDDGRGSELLARYESNPDVEVILVTGHGSVDTAVDALRRGAHDYLTKPIDSARLKSLLVGLERTHGLKRKVGRLRSELRQLGRYGRLVGASAAMQELYSLIERVAPTEAGVLIVGESGSGKELVARTIHDESERDQGPFVPINCGAVSATLIESELFGHERGAFTGADRSREGCFERADGGTLFLDEITEMSPDLQVKLLRVLENRQVQRVGASTLRDVDVRILAATNRDPAEAVEQGQLRGDLYYRLNVFPLAVPSLRERKDDIELLALHFLDGLNERSGTKKGLSGNALAALRAHDWPGNVRELSNVVQQSYILADELIDSSSLPRGFAARTVKEGATLRVQVGTPVAEVEKRLLLATLAWLDGDKKATATSLGISVKTLYNRLNQYAEEDAAREGEEREARPA